MRKYIIGILIGASLMFSMQSFAEDGLQSVSAFLRSGLPFTLDGKVVKLDSPVITYNDSTYVKLRDITKLTGNGIVYNDRTGVVEMTSVTDSVYATNEPVSSPEASVEPSATADPAEIALATPQPPGPFVIPGPAPRIIFTGEDVPDLPNKSGNTPQQ